jgi:acetoin utilization protein AcuC
MADPGDTAAARPEIPLPIDMSDGTPHQVPFPPWDGEVEMDVDGAIQEARTAIYPLHGLDPHDFRD